MKKRFLGHFPVILACATLVFVFVSSLTQKAVSQAPSEGQREMKLVVHYEPSSMDVVQLMLDMAKVEKDDLVYDLGCGDGRIVIAAAQERGARGVGVDLDPQRIKESLENARKANVTDRVQFFQQDLFQTEIGKATVVMLYLYPEVNLKLRPKLFRELKPGTRVVSHSHDMETWRADHTMTASNGHTVYFWVIPANVTGTWQWDQPGETERCLLKLNQQFQEVSGTLRFGPDEIPIQDMELRGDRLQFTVAQSSKGQRQTRRFIGRVQGHLMEGAVEETTGDSPGKRAWKATRIPSTMKPLD
jgi:precorrin-6B methylase 2